MKNLDFLPARFHQAVRRRQLNRKNTLLSIVLAIGLVGLYTMNDSRLRSAQAALQTLQADDALRAQQRARLEVLTVRKQILSQREAVIADLDDDAPCDAVLAEISRLLSDEMAVRSLSLEIQTIVPEGKEEIDPVRDRGPTRLVLRGEARSDVQVGIFVGKLSACPLFDELQLKFLRAAESSGALERAFELAFTVKRVALDR